MGEFPPLIALRRDSARRAWEEWRDALVALPDLLAVERGLRAIAVEMCRVLGERRDDPTCWSALGVDVAVVALHVQARAMSDVGGERIVLVDSEQPRDRHPFIAAHEVGHLLLSGVHRRGRTRLPADIEEELCDVFAREILRGTGAWVRDVSGVTTRAG